MTSWLAILAIGAGVGFLAGLFGKGGSALATPLLHAVGVPALVAVATPLPAAIPSTLVASVPYWRAQLVDREVLRWTLGFGLPATLLGALASRWVSGDLLVHLTDALLVVIGVRTLARPRAAVSPPAAAAAEGPAADGAPTEGPATATAVAGPATAAGARAASAGRVLATTKVATTTVTAAPGTSGRASVDRRARLAATGLAVGLASGLLANSGGFLLVPLYLTVLRLPIKSAFAASLMVSAVLAVPGSAVHIALGHVDWRVLAIFGAASVPFAGVGARVALATDAVRLERVYGAGLSLLGGGFLALTAF